MRKGQGHRQGGHPPSRPEPEGGEARFGDDGTHPGRWSATYIPDWDPQFSEFLLKRSPAPRRPSPQPPLLGLSFCPAQGQCPPPPAPAALAHKTLPLSGIQGFHSGHAGCRQTARGSGGSPHLHLRIIDHCPRAVISHVLSGFQLFEMWGGGSLARSCEVSMAESGN